MFQLIETICYEKGFLHRIPLHEERMNRSRHQLLGCLDSLSLAPLLSIPEPLKAQKVKCRVTYAKKIENIEYETYIQKEILSLKLVTDDSIDYAYKSKNRDPLISLLNKRGMADEILIIKNGQITDTSFSNIVFLKEGTWFTPKFPLLPGTRRADYLQKRVIFPRIITTDDLYSYEEARLINAMRSLEEAVSIPITSIY
ncbi:MAG: aminotransferase class IV [Bacteroidetes bacterium]|nr:aminotransferase class IV [Bacteroidota bacterium]